MTSPFEPIYRAHASAVLRLCRRLLRGRLAMFCDDAAQETWISALQSGCAGSGEAERRRWLLRLARRRCTDVVRRELGRRGQRRQESLEQIARLGAPQFRDPHPGALEVVLGAERQRGIRRKLARLERRQRLVLRALYFDERLEREVATELGVGESRVSYLKTAALEALRRKLVAA